jgi:hypothetical protein
VTRNHNHNHKPWFGYGLGRTPNQTKAKPFGALSTPVMSFFPPNIINSIQSPLTPWSPYRAPNGIAWYGNTMVWYGMVWYGMVSLPYGMVLGSYHTIPYHGNTIPLLFIENYYVRRTDILATLIFHSVLSRYCMHRAQSLHQFIMFIVNRSLLCNSSIRRDY